jgi:flavodoxin
MRSLVIYDSIFGNTEKIAKAVASALDAEIINVNKPKKINYDDFDLIVFGSPTHGGRPTEELQKFIDSKVNISGKKFATFDTRSNMKWVKIFGFAADRMSASLQAKGGQFLGESVGFHVSNKQGPLIDSEISRAESWARRLAKY